MTAIAPTAAVAAGPSLFATLASMAPPAAAAAPTATAPAAGGFADMLSKGVGQVEQKLDVADDMVRRLALGEELPIHQVSYALEQARLSVELAMQVRSHLLEGYRELMNMQL